MHGEWAPAAQYKVSQMIQNEPERVVELLRRQSVQQRHDGFRTSSSGFMIPNTSPGWSPIHRASQAHNWSECAKIIDPGPAHLAPKSFEGFASRPTYSAAGQHFPRAVAPRGITSDSNRSPMSRVQPGERLPVLQPGCRGGGTGRDGQRLADLRLFHTTSPVHNSEVPRSVNWSPGSIQR